MDENKIRAKVTQAICEFDMIAEGDRILVAVSGGKDSTCLAMMLREIRRRSRVAFDFGCVMLDQGQPGFSPGPYLSWMTHMGIPVELVREDTYQIVKEKTGPGKSFCGLCSRLRRGVLYNYAADHGYNKIALGHHRDDLNETVLLNMLYTGRISSMPPVLRSDDGRNTVIRPLVYLSEEQIADYIRLLGPPLIPCNLCGSQDGLRRQKIKHLLRGLEKEDPHIGSSLLKAQGNVRPSQLMDRRIWDFQ